MTSILDDPLPQLIGLMVLDAVSGREDVGTVDEGATADENVVKLLFLQDGNLPRVLSCRYRRERGLLKLRTKYCKHRSHVQFNAK